MDNSGTRLNKFLASCGIGSRRACDQMIQDGLVTVNGKIEDNPAVRVTSDDYVKMGGKRVQTLSSETILINKPRGLVCSKNDELNRDTVYALIPLKYQHLNHVGRLDKESEGLLLLTNDGALAQSLTHPSKKIEKEYIVTVDQSFENDVLTKFLKGVHTPEGKAQAKSVRRLSPRRVRIVLETGLKRQIRMMFQACHIRVTKLVRVRIGTLEADNLQPGRFHVLEQAEIDRLFAEPEFDPTVTTLESREKYRQGKKVDKPATPKKWQRPATRSHDGSAASDRPSKKKFERRNDSEDRRSSGPRRGPSTPGRSSGPRRDGPSSGGPRRNGPATGGPRKFGNKPSGGRPSGGRSNGPRKRD